MTSVSEAETAALVLRYLEGNAFPKAANTFRREAKKLLASIVAPATVKSLNAILNEFVLLKEQEVKRKQLAKAHAFIGDLLAVIDTHTGSQASQSDQPKKSAPPQKQVVDKPHPHDPPVVPSATELPELSDVHGCMDQQHELHAAATVPDEVCIQPQQQQGSDEHQFTDTPFQELSVSHATEPASLTSKQPASSQHRKGAPKRRTAQTDTWPSPINASSTLASEQVPASAFEWMNLPVTENGLSSLMRNDDFQQRFAEGLATHLTSGTDLHSSTSHTYDELLAGLPADPAMAGLLEPLVLPAEAYQLPPALQNGTSQLLHIQTSSQEPQQQQPPQPMAASLQDDGDQAMPAAAIEEHDAPPAAAVKEQQHNGLDSAPTTNPVLSVEYSQVMGQQQQQQLCWEHPQQLPSAQTAQPDPEPSHATSDAQTCQQPEMTATQGQVQGYSLMNAPLAPSASAAYDQIPAQSTAVTSDSLEQAALNEVQPPPRTVAPSGVPRIHEDLPAALAQQHRSKSVKPRAKNLSNRPPAAVVTGSVAEQLVDRAQHVTTGQQQAHQSDQLNLEGSHNHALDAPAVHSKATHEPPAQIGIEQHVPQRKRRHRSPVSREALEAPSGRAGDADPLAKKTKQKSPRKVLGSLPDNQRHNAEAHDSAPVPGSNADASLGKLRAQAFKAAKPDLDKIEMFIRNLHMPA